MRKNFFIATTILLFVVSNIFGWLWYARGETSIRDLDVYTMVTTDVSNCDSLADSLNSLNLTGYWGTRAKLESWALEHQQPITEDLNAFFENALKVRELAIVDGYRVGILLFPTSEIDEWVVFNYAFVRNRINSFKLYYWHCELVGELGLWEYGK